MNSRAGTSNPQVFTTRGMNGTLLANLVLGKIQNSSECMSIGGPHQKGKDAKQTSGSSCGTLWIQQRVL